MPLWAQLADVLRKQVDVHTGDAAPLTEAVLMRTYAVSRHTVREALRALATEGVVERRQGIGTFVVPARFEQPVHGLYSLAATITGHGVEEHSEVRALRTEEAGGRAAQLAIPPTDAVVYVERLRLAGGEPLALDRSWLPHDLARGLLGAPLGSGSLYAQLQARCAITVGGGRERIRPIAPGREIAALLHLPRGSAAFGLQRLVRSGDRVVEWRESIVRGDCYAFVVDWRG